jgi:hypothetical protein
VEFLLLLVRGHQNDTRPRESLCEAQSQVVRTKQKALFREGAETNGNRQQESHVRFSTRDTRQTKVHTRCMFVAYAHVLCMYMYVCVCVCVCVCVYTCTVMCVHT